MNRNKKPIFGNYYYSIRTSGEAVGWFTRDIEVICKLVLFIECKFTINFYMQDLFCDF